jgi:hypothetical protein
LDKIHNFSLKKDLNSLEYLLDKEKVKVNLSKLFTKNNPFSLIYAPSNFKIDSKFIVNVYNFLRNLIAQFGIKNEF